MLWFWLFVGPALLLALRSLAGERERAAYTRQRLSKQPERLPPASVIVPVKGHDEGLRENLAALAALDYPDYELVITAHSAHDIPPGVLPHRAKVVLAHTDPSSASEKVVNLLAAVQGTRKRTEVFAFADSDGRVTAGWLRALVAPLAEEGVAATTGYRWFTPRRPGWALLRSVWDAVAAGTLGPGDNRFAWGGAMAIHKEMFFQTRVPEHWKNAISDDYALSNAVHQAGLAIAYAPGALVPCLESITGRRLLAWMRRQMMITRAYNPRIWWPGLIAHVIYCGAMVAAGFAIARGHRLAALALAAQLAPGMLKGWLRMHHARHVLPEYARWFRRWGWVHVAAVPVATWLWLMALGSSAFGHTIHWRGYRYNLKMARPV